MVIAVHYSNYVCTLGLGNVPINFQHCESIILQLFEMAIISHMQYIAMCCSYVSHTNNANVVLSALCDNVNTVASALPY